MSTHVFDEGDMVRVTVEFAREGALVDPGVVVLHVQPPSAGSFVNAHTRDSVGQYHAEIVATAPGTWYYRWEGTGANQAAEEGSFQVRQRRVPAPT